MTVAAICFSPDGMFLATATADSTLDPGEARIWDAETGAARGPGLEHKDGRPRTLLSVPTAVGVATASEDFTAVVWDRANGRIVGRALRQPDEINAVCFASTRSWLATGCRNYDARVWDLETSEPLTPPLHHSARVIRVRFVEDDTALLTETSDARSWLWRLAFDERPVDQIQRWARILSADRSGPPALTPSTSQPSLVDTFEELNSTSAQIQPGRANHNDNRRPN